jgi:hypothetical protein
LEGLELGSAVTGVGAGVVVGDCELPSSKSKPVLVFVGATVRGGGGVALIVAEEVSTALMLLS